MNAGHTEKIAVDAMGADQGPGEVVAAVRLALLRGYAPGGLEVVGHPHTVPPLLAQMGLAAHPLVSFFPATEVIGMHEKPVQSLKTKKDASLVQAVERVRQGACGAVVSCGNTGALMACATLRLRPLEGIAKPALATVWPGKDTHFVVLDSGANPLCKAENLVHYAILGSAYARVVLGRDKPRVGLLSMSAVEGSGTPLTNAAHEALRRLEGQIHYLGLLEGSRVFEDAVDVVVTNGFTGNVLLKTFQAFWGQLKTVAREEARCHPARLLGTFLLRSAQRQARQRVDIHRHGGAPLLGVRGNVIKAHGSSGREAIAGSIQTAARLAGSDFQGRLSGEIARANVSLHARGTPARSLGFPSVP